MAITLQQMQAMGRKFARAIDTRKLSRLGANNAAGIIKPRIFNDGLDTRGRPLRPIGAKGKRMGAYSEYYAKKRRKAGRQVQKVDLEFSGRLRRNTGIGRDGKGYAFGIRATGRRDSKLNNVQIAGEMEALYGTEIFGASKDEQDKVIKAQLKAAEKMLNKAFR